MMQGARVLRIALLKPEATAVKNLIAINRAHNICEIHLG
jgi:hypothetical protein